ncbi:uracil-DNA glycosylase [Haematococcus lacustris]|uniref:Uracil-DNA glycosylase n=1 Tax=Haematococcus lacustris TaxID=44745 RepID=A0A699ZTG9_HAELA|nr:uracil-DNA glycosylase [Haematococcus lacustris]
MAAAIQAVSRQRSGVVFMLWGKPAQEKEKLIDTGRHTVLKAPHPSPLAAASGHAFIGCGHFSQANAELARQGVQPIDWQIT